MISLIDVTCHGDAPLPHPVLGRVSVIFRAGERVGILARPGRGKSTLARLLCGMDRPDAGVLRRQGRVSWPIGSSGFLHPDLTGAMNIAIAARALGADPAETLAFCTRLTGQPDGFARRMGGYAPSVRAALACAFSLSQRCDWYIADETIGFGEGPQRARSDAMLERRLAEAGLIFITRNVTQMGKWCDRHFALHGGRLIEVEDAAMAAAVLETARMAEDTA